MTTSVTFEFLGAGIEILYGAKGGSILPVRAYLQSEVNEFMDGVLKGDLHEDERQGADAFLGVWFGAFDAAGMDLYALRSIEGSIGEDDVFQRELGIFGFDHTAEVRDVPIIEGFLAADIFSKIGCHAISLTEGRTFLSDVFPTRAAFTSLFVGKGVTRMIFRRLYTWRWATNIHSKSKREIDRDDGRRKYMMHNNVNSR